jgi:hypothetical protein
MHLLAGQPSRHTAKSSQAVHAARHRPPLAGQHAPHGASQVLPELCRPSDVSSERSCADHVLTPVPRVLKPISSIITQAVYSVDRHAAHPHSC